MAVQELITVNIEESDLDYFGKERTTQLVPAQEVIPIKTQQLNLNQAISLGYRNPSIHPKRKPVGTGLKGLED